MKSQSLSGADLMKAVVVVAVLLSGAWWYYSPHKSPPEQSSSTQILPPDFRSAISNHEINVGMTQSQVQQSMSGDSRQRLRGLPRITTTETPSGKIETWMFEDKEMLTFVDGKLSQYTH